MGSCIAQADSRPLCGRINYHQCLDEPDRHTENYFLLFAICQQALLGQTRVELNLIDNGNDIDLGQQDIEVLDTEVGDSYGSYFA
jgi:hypothetical protein